MKNILRILFTNENVKIIYLCNSMIFDVVIQVYYKCGNNDILYLLD
ncbi:MAG: hypothetical protein HY963_03755 [Ignavibacteriales bacterium]|nr:hypothetical protein [Ignavibacteriales bacterium]